MKTPIEKTTLRRWPGIAAVLTGMLLISACMTVGPDYVKPVARAPEQWNSTLNDDLSQTPISPATLTAWWKAFDDPLLTDLLERAVVNNLNVKEAQARIRESRARRGISRSGLYPSVNTTGSAVKGESAESGGQRRETELYSAGFDAGWELDLFGRVRRTVEAAEATIDAQSASLQNTLVTLLAEAALNYVELRTFQTRIIVARENLLAQEETYQIAFAKFQAGLTNELAVQQALYNLSSTRSQIPTLETGLEQAKNRLAVLLGLTPGRLHDTLAAPGPIPVSAVTLAVGIPADTLRQRPDVRQAERLLAAQTARIGAAEADRYPKISLSGSIGLEALTLGDMFTGATRLWRLGPSISWPLFDAGAIRSNIAVQTALQEQALYQYEAAVLAALEEVENNLTAYVQEQLRRQALIEAEQAAQKAVILAQNQFKAGLVDFNNVLEAQRSARSFQDSLAQSEGTVTANLIRLYKSLGGGWTSFVSENPISGE